MTASLLLAALAASSSPDVLQKAHCPAQAGEYDVTLPGELVLHRDFLDPALSPEDNAKAAVLQQVKYVWGWLRTNPKMHETLQAVLSAEPPAITVSLKDGKYGRDMVLDWEQQKPHLVIDDVYTLRAITRGRTRAADPAVIVKYTVTFRMALCGPSRAPATTMEMPLPRDPWLMYWHVPRKLHRFMRYYTKSAVTNPCSDDDFADLPHPIYYWYDWQPDRKANDADGKPFDCTTMLRSGRDHFPHVLSLRRVSAPTGDFTQLRAALARDEGTLRVSLVLGVLDHEVTKPAVDVIAGELAGGAPLAERVSTALASDRARERAERQLFALLRDLGEVLDVRTHQATHDGAYLHLDVEGTLRRSGRPARLRVHYGLTNVFGPVPPAHWRFAREALAQDHVVIYVGHSGIGENMRLVQIEKNLGLKPGQLDDEIARAPYQMIAFHSCYSYMYFGQDMLEAGARGREFVFTGTGYGKGDRGTLMVLDLVDQVLAPGAAPPVIRYLDDEDFLLFKARHPVSAPPR